MLIYKILRAEEWRTLQSQGETPGAPEMRCRGCGAKVASDILRRSLETIAKMDGGARGCAPSGMPGSDDAAIIELPENKVLIQTVDHFPALVDDPHLFGRIAANHC